ncbi:MAG: hypothetical protein A4E19_19060 [Nitrospira sp. SG-bin1]|nr:MAG: hypothetical protein A4E19_19060 [Nitrospira sp. SG-bin1]
MPVNMDPTKKRRRSPTPEAAGEDRPTDSTVSSATRAFGEETDADREKELADAELKNLWDATEVIDMDKV